MEFTLDLVQDDVTGDWTVTIFDEIQSDIIFNSTNANVEALMAEVGEAILEHKGTGTGI